MDLKAARRELTALLELDSRTPGQLRKTAELTELLYTDEKARPWWERAKEAGDEAAIGYVEVLVELEETGLTVDEAYADGKEWLRRFLLRDKEG